MHVNISGRRVNDICFIMPTRQLIQTPLQHKNNSVIYIEYKTYKFTVCIHAIALFNAKTRMNMISYQVSLIHLPVALLFWIKVTSSIIAAPLLIHIRTASWAK